MANEELDKDYEERFPNTTLGLSNNVYIVEEKSFIEFANVDDVIMTYLNNHNLLGVKTTAVEFSTNEGVYEIIYVSSQDDFITARDQFFENFISKETLNKLNNNQALYRRIYRQKFMIAQRNKDSKAIQKDFEQWKKEAKDKVNKMKKGKLTEKEVYKWLVENK